MLGGVSCCLVRELRVCRFCGNAAYSRRQRRVFHHAHLKMMATVGFSVCAFFIGFLDIRKYTLRQVFRFHQQDHIGSKPHQALFFCGSLPLFLIARRIQPCLAFVDHELTLFYTRIDWHPRWYGNRTRRNLALNITGVKLEGQKTV